MSSWNFFNVCWCGIGLRTSIHGRCVYEIEVVFCSRLWLRTELQSIISLHEFCVWTFYTWTNVLLNEVNYTKMDLHKRQCIEKCCWFYWYCWGHWDQLGVWGHWGQWPLVLLGLLGPQGTMDPFDGCSGPSRLIGVSNSLISNSDF